MKVSRAIKQTQTKTNIQLSNIQFIEAKYADLHISTANKLPVYTNIKILIH